MLLALLHAGAAVWVLVVPVPLIAQWVSLLGIVCSGFYYVCRYALQRHPLAVTRMVWLHDDQWQVFQRNGQQFTASLHNGAFVHPWLVVVPLNLEKGGRRRVAVIADAAPHELFRRLRVRLHAWVEPPRDVKVFGFNIGKKRG
ncbi:MAG: hypothetical protein OEW08_11230 [Gammaproteobacteria bacterium]|nr:hypothetical protein [Gammaproteobacteria bacterium]